MEFQAFPKLPRLNRTMTVTEKIDGTNACVVIDQDGNFFSAQSRKRWIKPGDDNMGFAAWCHEYQLPLAATLGPGYHYGEWYGEGIQGNPYGISGKRFALFNPDRYEDLTEANAELAGLEVVPLVARCQFDTHVINELAKALAVGGTLLPHATTNYVEGVVAFHHAARVSFKVTCENDEKPKGSQEVG